jgi:DUF2075 family protein
MRLYAGTSLEFVRDTTHNCIADRLKEAFQAHFHYPPSPSEVNSWRNSLGQLSLVMNEAKLDDHGVMLEYQLPLTSRRLDCMITGHTAEKRGSAVIIELKQWSKCSFVEAEDLVVETYVGGGNRYRLHPSAQANQYRRYLADLHEAFHGTNPLDLAACAYLHNYRVNEDDPLLHSKFKDVRGQVPLFAMDDVPRLVSYLNGRLEGGNGMDVLDRVENSRLRPSKRLMDHVKHVINREPRFILLDEQQVVFQRVLASVQKSLERKKKQVFLVHGGPGTGKSVLAINLMSEISGQGKNAQYATGSKAFTQTIRKIVGPRAAQQLKYFNNYGHAEVGGVDVLICDEAHRLRQFSHDRFTPAAKRTNKPQIQEILDASKVSVFFIDDRQVVRPGEVGSSDLIKMFAAQNDCELYEHKLEAQFRCSGSDAFVQWVDHTLGIQETATPLWYQREEPFEVRIFNSPEEVEAAIRAKAAEGHSARMMAGFCWPWSPETQADGSLVEDVVIGDYKRPWNARPELRGLKKGIPPAELWAYDPNGLEQVGCVYTAQGFEFDYAGVIWGSDLVYDPDKGAWVGQRQHSKDMVVSRSKDQFTDLVKNTYRVLLTRGLKGCYLCFTDKATERLVRSRTEGLGETPATASKLKPVHQPFPEPEPEALKAFPFKEVPPSRLKPYENALPVVNLKLAAGVFGGTAALDHDEVIWVEPPDFVRPAQGLFIARVVGESMNRRIPNGSWCLFRLNPGGTRNGKVVVAQHRSIEDPDLGGQYTVKVYWSEKAPTDEGGWRHSRVRLLPDSTQPTFQPMEFTSEDAEVLVIAELVTVLADQA